MAVVGALFNLEFMSLRVEVGNPNLEEFNFLVLIEEVNKTLDCSYLLFHNNPGQRI